MSNKPTTTNDPNPKEDDMNTNNLTVDNMATEITKRGYDANVAGYTFIKAVGPRMDEMTAEERGSKMANAFSEALNWHQFLPENLLSNVEDVNIALGLAAVAILEESGTIKRIGR